MPRVVYQDYNHQARGRCDHKPDIAQVGMTTIKFKVKLMKPQNTQCSYQTTVHKSHLWHCQKL